MKKMYTLFLAVAIAFFILPFAHQTTTLADAKVYDNIKDGEYKITAKALNKDTGEASGAASFINEAALLTVKDGAAELTITIPENEMATITGLQIEGVQPTVTSGGNYTYKLAALKSELNAQVQYEVPAMNIDHDVPLKFALVGLDDLPVIADEPIEEEVIEEEEEVEDELEEGNEEVADDSDSSRVEGTLVQDADEVYTINYVTSTQMIERYFENPVTLLKKDGKQYVQISGNSAHLITSLTINGTEVTWGNIADDNTYVFEFELPGSLIDELDFGMTIDTGNPQFGEMNHTVSLSFDPATQEVVKGPEEEPEEETEKPKEETEKPVEQPKEEPKKDEKAQLTPDKAYEIGFLIKQKNGSGNSVANDFFVKPALLLEKDGKKYVQLTITNGDMVKELKNKYGDALLVKNNSDGSIVVQLRVDDDLSDMLLHMRVVVPAMPGFPGYDTEHDALLVFDQNSLKEIDVNEHMLVGTSDTNNESGPTVTDGATPVKPVFGETEEEEVITTAQSSGVNPQTGDTTNIMLYALLLVGSLIPLVIKARRRFV